MIYLQFDYEFETMLTRVIWVGKHVHDKIDRYFESSDYEVLVEFEINSSRQPSVHEIMDGNMPWADKLWTDSMAFKFLFDKLFVNGNDWPQIEFE
jgi:hypothetical protein